MCTGPTWDPPLHSQHWIPFPLIHSRSFLQQFPLLPCNFISPSLRGHLHDYKTFCKSSIFSRPSLLPKASAISLLPLKSTFLKCWLYSVPLLPHASFSLKILPPRPCFPHSRQTMTLVQITQGLFAPKFIRKFLGFILLSLLSTMSPATLSYKMPLL